MSSNHKQALTIWAASLAAIPVGAGIFGLVFAWFSQMLREAMNADTGSLLSGASGTVASDYAAAILIGLGALSGFGLVHSFGRRFRFGVGWFVVAAAILTLCPIWILSAAVLEFAGRELWISTGGLFLTWNFAVGFLGYWMIKTAPRA